MIPELGQLALVLALILALVQGVSLLWGAHSGRGELLALARPSVTGQTVFAALAYVALTISFVQHDFSVLFVYLHSNVDLPLFYRIAAVWGGHEGSLLLWILVLALWTLAVAVFSRQMPETFRARVLGVLGLISAGFIGFTLFTSNPFERLIPAQLDGRDLNALLQDPAMVIHPPMLYIGYVGLSVVFAFAVAVLLENRRSTDWARWARPWTVGAWLFLTMGISLGSWWAYYELGWGGWWFWDPVENASFMPWLIATALIHSLPATEKRGLFRSWTLLLAIAAFSLSMLGTFLVRSGILVSVHSFASDPARGLYILAFLGLMTGAALALYAWRAPSMGSDAGFKPLSRETFLLANNVLLVIATLLILLGTLYPLFLDALNLGRISVGPPFFDLAFAVPMLPLVFLLGLGMHTAWKRMDGRPLLYKLRIPAALALVLGVLVPVVFYGGGSVMTVAGVAAAFWVMLSSLLDLLPRRRSAALTRSHVGMCLAHFGVGMFILGATVVSVYDFQTDRSISPGQTLTVERSEYEFTYVGHRVVNGPNWVADEIAVDVHRDGRLVTTLYPQKRFYNAQNQLMTQTAIGANWYRDILISLGEPLGQDAWSVRIQYKPLVRLIWLGTIFMAIGGIVAISDRRYRWVRSEAAQRATAAGGSGNGRTPVTGGA